MATTHVEERGAAYTPLSIPDRRHPHGPVTRARIRRSQIGLGVVWAIGLLPVVLDGSDRLKAAGLGLLAPGAGFLFTADPLLFVATVALFALAFFGWFATGNIVAPPLVWAAAAGLAALRADSGTWPAAEVAVPAGLAGVALVGLVVGQVRFRAARRRADVLNQELAEVEYAAPAEPATMPLAPELTAEDLAAQRFLFDLGLQPMDRFEGFDWVDQFQTAAVRYQLTYGQVALAMASFAHTPAFTGYSQEAQRRLIEKMQDKRMWRFWFLENLWGYLKIQRNPIPPRDNIMFTGYLGTMLGAYEQTTGDERFNRPGALSFRWDDDHVYEHNFASIAENVHDNMTVSPFCFYPCEPNWVYSMCNAIGINTLITHDRLRGTDYWEDIAESYRRGLEEEFLTTDGRLVGIRSARMGFGLPAITSTMADSLTAFWLSSSVPDVARRSWEMVRRRFVRLGEDGSVELERSGWDNIDTGNYKPGTDIVVCWGVMLAAREHGDEETFEAVQRYADAKFEPVVQDGARRYARGSTQANIALALARFGREHGLRDLMRHGRPPEWRDGPVLSQAAYPDVLVARAVSDGADLDLVLRSGDGGGRTTLGLERLTPDRAYVVEGALGDRVSAGPEGCAYVEVDLDPDARLEVRLRPEA